MTTTPAALPPIKPLRLPEKRDDAKPFIPAACWSPEIPTFDGYSLIECDELRCYVDAWLAGSREDFDGLPMFEQIHAHLNTCPRCRSAAARFREPSAELVERLETGHFWDVAEGD